MNNHSSWLKGDSAIFFFFKHMNDLALLEELFNFPSGSSSTSLMSVLMSHVWDTPLMLTCDAGQIFGVSVCVVVVAMQTWILGNSFVEGPAEVKQASFILLRCDISSLCQTVERGITSRTPSSPVTPTHLSSSLFFPFFFFKIPFLSFPKSFVHPFSTVGLIPLRTAHCLWCSSFLMCLNVL